MLGVGVDGLAELRRDLRRVGNAEGLVEVREALRSAAQLVVRDAQGRIPSRTGRARASVRATVGGNRAYVVGGRAKVPYYGFLDFGSRNPRTGQPRRVGPWANSGKGPARGRYLYPAIARQSDEMVREVERALDEALRHLGL